MEVEWQENAYCWIGTSKTVYPRFEAWRSFDSPDDHWCLNMTQSPDAEPITVRQLPSLDDAKEFAEGLLAEFEHVNENIVPVRSHFDSQERQAPRVASARPQPQAPLRTRAVALWRSWQSVQSPSE
jgi:hypothetical protein